MKPLVAIVGRPNVGKSTLFNKIIRQKKAIATDEPGVTRDLNFADVEEGGKLFTLVDTGGFEPKPSGEITAKIKEQAFLAIEEADLIIFVMDGREGPNADDLDIIKTLRRSGTPTLYAANKIDTATSEGLMADFYSAGLGEVFGVSAEHGLGVYELLDALIAGLPESDAIAEEPKEGEVRVAIVGRPNAGKSSLLNRFIGKERAIVSDIAGTTRDTVDMGYSRGGKDYLFVDTAGIRKKNRISRTVETYCVMEAIRSIDRCHVGLLVIDANEGVSSQDERIAGLIERRGRGCVIVINKWDVVEKDDKVIGRFVDSVREKIPFLSYAPIHFVSALTGKRVFEILDSVDLVAKESANRITTNKLNKVFEDIKARKSAPLHRGRNVKFYYITQTGIRPPTFVVFTNYPDAVPESYRRFIMNSLRASLDVASVPIRVHIRGRDRGKA